MLQPHHPLAGLRLGWELQWQAFWGPKGVQSPTLQVEPQWQQLPSMSVPEFWLGLRARNWTSGAHYNPQVWVLRFFGVTVFTAVYKKKTALLAVYEP